MLKRGVPSVVLVTERFEGLARATLKGRRMPGAPMVILPETEQTEYGDKDVMESIAEKTLDDVATVIAPESVRKATPAV